MSEIVAHPEDYFKQLLPPRDVLMRQLEAQAKHEDIPIIGPLVGQLLYVLAVAVQARRILELGTATGYSAIFLAQACRRFDGQVISLELDSDMAAQARSNLQQAGLRQWVNVREGDALEILPQLQTSFDFIFMDIEKADYAKALPHCGRLLKTGRMLVADNTGFADADRFNRKIHADSDWSSAHLYGFWPQHSPNYDGLCIAVKS